MEFCRDVTGGARPLSLRRRNHLSSSGWIKCVPLLFLRAIYGRDSHATRETMPKGDSKILVPSTMRLRRILIYVYLFHTIYSNLIMNLPLSFLLILHFR